MPENPRPITMKDIAKEAGITIASVSNALRGTSKVSVATRDRVRAIAKKLGYRRNPAFAALGALAHRHPTARNGLPLGFLRQRRINGVDYCDALTIAGMKNGCIQLGYHLETSI